MDAQFFRRTRLAPPLSGPGELRDRSRRAADGPPPPRDHYRRSRREAAEQAAGREARARRVSHLRTGAFLLAAAALLLLETSDRELWWLLLGVATLGATAFLFLVVRHRRLRREIRRSEIRERMAEEGEARLDRDWDRIPQGRGRDPGKDHPSAWDLDLVGRASLEQLLGRATTAPGRTLLRRWILDPLAATPTSAESLLRFSPPSRGSGPSSAPSYEAHPRPDWKETVAERQDVVRLLARETAFRENLELAGRDVEGREAPSRVRALLAWARGQPWLADRKGIRLIGVLLGLFTPLTLAGWFMGAVHGFLPVLGAVAALVLHRRLGPEAARRMDAAEAGEGALERWVAVLDLIEEMPAPDDAPVLGRLRETVRSPAPGAAEALRRLRRIVDTAGVRRSALAHFPLVVLFAWDVHMLAWLERWQDRHGASVEGWILALARTEALVSLGGLLHDHPDWSFPTFSEKPDAGLRARAMAHPLLPPATCVPNDVELPAPGRLLLITGSNMAGKTTLLRALGTNQVLALMGAPVAARELRTRPMPPWTAMRIRDSLVDGVSYFLAELRRLRRLVDAAREGPVLFLLDEILQGTNTAERRTAARIVLDHLLRTGSVGAVTTHDLTLADHADLEHRLAQVHFREEVREVEGVRKLEFDYVLRPGPATSRNALLLLELVGLGPADDPEGAPPTP